MRYEASTAEGWRAIPFADLVVGMLFRLIGAEGAPVEDVDGVSRWCVTGRTAAGELETESVPETEVERQVRERGMFWPGAQTNVVWPPGRLR